MTQTRQELDVLGNEVREHVERASKGFQDFNSEIVLLREAAKGEFRVSVIVVRSLVDSVEKRNIDDANPVGSENPGHLPPKGRWIGNMLEHIREDYRVERTILKWKGSGEVNLAI